ncbi:unnamed protein product [Sphenostylis stenocarpa]|uniref:Secreted protein n=1 Tax=Sphenostylis stenocarpa TaxID=92480 RepID=A0AA86S4I8_9FABA|nr:unnamed protein product [Sphenostylis stenocarpa]
MLGGPVKLLLLVVKRLSGLMLSCAMRYQVACVWQISAPQPPRRPTPTHYGYPISVEARKEAIVFS